MAKSVATQKRKRDAVLFGIRGRDGFSAQFAIPEDKCREAFNIDFWKTSLARKRSGTSTVSTSGGSVFTACLALLRHVPSTDETAAELWAIDTDRWHRLSAGGWTDVALFNSGGDALVYSSAPRATGASLNGKFFVTFAHGADRLYVWDGTRFRRSGQVAPAVPTAANQGSGTYAATARSYKLAYTVQASGVTIRRSELSPALAFTPNGTSASVRVTKSAASQDGLETHWEIWGAFADGVYHLLSTVVVGTTTYDDSATTYTGTTAPDIGAYMTPPSAKFVVADDARLVMGGTWVDPTALIGPSDTPTKHNRVWWTSQLGSSNVGDDERISLVTDGVENFSDVESAITGISQPVNGEFFVFSWDAMWKFTATGDVNKPYTRIRVTGGQGCIDHKSIVMAEDENGNPAVYWTSPRGLMRYGANGLQYLGHDLNDIWTTMNLDTVLGDNALNTIAFALWYKEKRQVWVYLTAAGTYAGNFSGVSSPTKATCKVVYDVQSRGWSIHFGPSTINAQCCCMFAATIGAPMSRSLKPYVGFSNTQNANDCLSKADTGATDYNHYVPSGQATAFQAYLDSRPLTPWGLARFGGLTDEPILVADVGSAVSIQLTLTRDDGAETRTKSVVLTAVSDGGAETVVYPQFSGMQMAAASTLKVRLGDAAAISTAWNLHALVLQPEAEESK